MRNNIKTVLLTGGTGSIGIEAIRELSKEGFNIIFTSRDEKKIEKLELQFSDKTIYSGLVKGINIDFEKDEYYYKIEQFFKMNDIYPNVIINNVRDLNNLKVEQNGITSRFHFMNELLLGIIIPYELSMFMTNSDLFKIDNIINISSIYGVVPPNSILYEDGYASSPIQYGVAKAGLIHLTKELSVRLAGKNIRVNCISYGGIEGRADDNFKKKYSQLVPLGGMIKKAHICGPIKFLLSDNSFCMTGQNIIYDGGYTIW